MFDAGNESMFMTFKFEFDVFPLFSGIQLQDISTDGSLGTNAILDMRHAGKSVWNFAGETTILNNIQITSSVEAGINSSYKNNYELTFSSANAQYAFYEKQWALVIDPVRYVGDTNSDGIVSVADVVFMLSYLTDSNELQSVRNVKKSAIFDRFFSSTSNVNNDVDASGNPIISVADIVSLLQKLSTEDIYDKIV